MSASCSKTSLVYGQIRRALQSGRYAPGQWVDPDAIARESGASATPVRLALQRLVGAGLLEDHARAGIHVPLPSEVALRIRYDWMERLLLTACDIGPSQLATTDPRRIEAVTPNGDLVKGTWRLFDAIARATGHSDLYRAVKLANDQLASIRRAKQDLIEHGVEELLELVNHWNARDIRSLESAVRAYHERRKQLVPCIVATLVERRDALR